MAVPSPADAEAATVRLRLVADMLQQKAQEVQSKGNASAAQALADSATDVQRAAALVRELARLVHLPPPRLRSDSDASLSSIASSNDGSTISSLSAVARPPAASASVKDLVTRLGRVDAMLGKKSDEMRAKGNENAAHALQQSALAVRLGAQHIGEQQLMTRTLVVTARALREQLREHCRLVLADSEDVTDDTTLDDELMKRALERVHALVAMRDVVRAVAPTGGSLDALRERLVASPASSGDKDELEKVKTVNVALQRQLEETQARHERELRDATDATESMRIQCEALEKALEDLEAEYHERRERELEHLNALHERQKGTHEELKKLLLAKEEEVTALKIQADAWMNQLSRQQETLADLQEQREQDHQDYEREVTELRDQVRVRDGELRIARDDVRALREQLEAHQTDKEDEPVAASDETLLNELQGRVDALQRERDVLVAEREDSVIALEEAQVHLDTVRAELHARIEEVEQSAEVAVACVQEREARIAELSSSIQHHQGLEDRIAQLEQDLSDERTRNAELERQCNEGKVTLTAVQKELSERTHKLALLREEASTRSAETVSAQTAILLEHQERVSELEAALEHERTAIAGLETALREKSAALVQSDAALQVAREELARKTKQLDETQSEVNQAHEELLAWKQYLVDVASEIGAIQKDDAPLETTSANDVGTMVLNRCVKILSEVKELQAAKSTHETQVTILDTESEKLRTALTQLREEKNQIESQYEALEATQRASSEASGVKASESVELQKKLADVEAEFERYRTRSHAALKKIEKRAELLNSMRKDNETLTQTIAELKAALDAAVEKEQSVTARLDEATQSLHMREEEYARKLEEARAHVETAEDQCAALAAEKKEMEDQLDKANARVAMLQEEKEDIAQAEHAVHEQALELKAAELEETKLRAEEAIAARTRLEESVRDLEETIKRRDKQIETLETEMKTRQEAAERAVGREAEWEQQRDDMAAKMEMLTAQLEQTRQELTTAMASKAKPDDEHKIDVVSSVEHAALHAQLEAATRETEELSARLVDIQLAKVAAVQKAEQLSEQLAHLQSQEATSSASDEELAALKQSHEAQATKILRLLDEIETVSKHQIDDQRVVSELKEQLVLSEQRLADAHTELRRTQTTAPTNDAVDAAETIETLRARIVALETPHKLQEDGNGDEDSDLASLQATRQAKREQYEQELEAANRKKLVAEYVAKTMNVVAELQQRMDDYSSVFRDACALRDEEADHAADDDDTDGEALNGHADDEGPHEYEEYLTLKSGVVVKAGAEFSLPVYCEKPGWRVEWKFAVKEDGGDIGFALVVETTTSEGQRERETIVAPGRVHTLSGVYDATTTAALKFEWDNTFSWLNEKTLDYHLTVLEPLSASKKTLRHRDRALGAKTTALDERLAILRIERERRAQLATALEHAEACATEKDEYLARLGTRREAIQASKTTLHVRMDDLKTQLQTLVNELDDMATAERDIGKAWDALQGEQEDVAMTMGLSANSHLDELTEALEARLAHLQTERHEVTTALAT